MAKNNKNKKITDTDRMNWLETVNGKFYGVGELDQNGKEIDKVIFELDDENGENNCEGHNFRECIDWR